MSGCEPATPTKERCERADRMAKAEPPSLWLIIDQSVPARRYVSPAIQRAQLTRVADLVNRERLTVQMIPTSSPRHAGNSGPRRIITTADEPEVVYMESAEEGRIITDSAGVLQSRLLFTSLQRAARDPQEISEPSTTR